MRIRQIVELGIQGWVPQSPELSFRQSPVVVTQPRFESDELNPDAFTLRDGRLSDASVSFSIKWGC